MVMIMKKYRIGKAKRLTACMLAMVMLLSLAACGGEPAQGGGQGADTQTDGDASQGGSAEDSAGAGDSQSGQTVDNTVSIDTIYQAVKEAYGDDYLPSVMLSEDEILAMYGIQPDWCEELIAEVPIISAQVDTFIGVKAKEENLAQVSDAVNAYSEALKNDTMQYPINLNKIAASTIVTIGNYVFFIILGNISAEEEEGDDAAQIEAYEARNQVAVDTIESLLLK